MENNEIMKRLMQEDNHAGASKKVDSATSKQNKWDELPISRIRVVTAKYKVFIVLLLIFACIMLLEVIPNTKDSYKSSQSKYDQAKSQLVSIQREITDAENDMKLKWEIEDNEKSLKTCLNEKKKEVCLSLPESWAKWEGENKKYDFSIPLSYLQLNSLYNKKMPVDEKKVLKNLNEYLIKQDIEWTTRTRVWDILRISIWDPKAVTNGDTHFFEVPVDVEIEFTSVDDLIWFLYNVEKKLIDNGWDRILYKIQSVSYDVVSRDESQTTDISMLAYYYHDERFENVVEENSEEATAEAVEENNTTVSNETNKKSDSFFKRIFNS